MTDREDLVPDNLPYGERQATRQAMDQAGVPITSTAPSPPAGAPAGPPPGVMDDPGRVANMDLLSELDPAADQIPGLPQPNEPPLHAKYRQWQQAALTAQNTLVRATAQRMLHTIAQKIQQQSDPYVQMLSEVEPTAYGAIGGEKRYATDEEAEADSERILTEQYDRLGRVGGMLTKVAQDKILDLDNSVIRFNQVSNVVEVAGPRGIDVAYMMGVQAGQLLSADHTRADVDTMIAEGMKNVHSAKAGAFAAGLSAGYVEGVVP